MIGKGRDTGIHKNTMFSTKENSSFVKQQPCFLSYNFSFIENKRREIKVRRRVDVVSPYDSCTNRGSFRYFFLWIPCGR